MKKCLLLCCLAAVSAVWAEIKVNPDANTLWSMESASKKGWYQNTLSRGIRPNPNGGFFIGDDNPVNNGHVARHKVPVSKEYPWLVWDMKEVYTFHAGRYQRWSLSIQGLNGGIGSVTNVEKGLAAVNCFDNAKPLKPGTKEGILRAYFFDVEIGFTAIKMVKKPDNYIVASSPAFEKKKSFSPGDEVKFTVYLKEPAEDVTLKVIDINYLYDVAVNGKNVLELTPEDKEQKIWSITVKIESLKCGSRKIGSLLTRATVLGGGFKVPLWGAVNYPYKEDNK